MKEFIKAIISDAFNIPEINEYVATSVGMSDLVRMLHYNDIKTVIDVGANKGQYADMIFARGYNGKVISFEPLRDMHDILIQRKHTNWIIAERCAIGEQDSSVIINRADNVVSSSILPMNDTWDGYKIAPKYNGIEDTPMYQLDTILPKYVSAETRPFLKIDAQGYETHILDGAPETIKHLSGIQLECAIVPLYKGQIPFSDMIKKVEGMGFSLWYIINGVSSRNSYKRLLEADCIFFDNKKISMGENTWVL